MAPSVAVETANGFERNEVLSAAAFVEAQSEHPLAHAIVTAARKESVEVIPVGGFGSQTGLGVSDREIVVGNAAQMERVGADASAMRDVADRLRGDGAGVMFVAIDGKFAGLLAVADPIKPSARAAIAALRQEGLRIVMLTGDA